MLVNDKHLTTIWYDKAKEVVKIIDQRLLPFELKIVELKTLEDFCFAIKEMQVRGAPLIGVTAAYGMYVYLWARSRARFHITRAAPTGWPACPFTSLFFPAKRRHAATCSVEVLLTVALHQSCSRVE